MNRFNKDYQRVPQAPARQNFNPNPASASSSSIPAGARESVGAPKTIMKVANCPAQELALTNRAYCSPNDSRQFLLPSGSGDAMVLVANQIVLTVEAHNAVADGAIGLNVIHRRNVKVSPNEDVQVSRFVPEKGIELVVLTVELEFLKYKGKQEALDAGILSPKLIKQFGGQVMTVGQKVSFEHNGINYTFNVKGALLGDQVESSRGLVTKSTHILFETAGNSGIKIANQQGGGSSNLFKAKDFNFQKLGIGGLDKEFQDIFRRAFASRVYPRNVISKLGIDHVKGMLLWGPPGTGKTLIARQIGKMLNGRDPKIVNGPEILSKFVGETEKNVRDLFADAEVDQREHGDQSELHIIIFDEIDAICKARGSTRDGTGVHDSIVNQLLTKIDGVEALNNILLIGMTNRKDMLDEALLRPGRLEVQIEIGLPDEKGRVQILHIHSSKMQESSFLSKDVSLEELAVRTKNFSGAELAGLVKSAVSFALNRQINFDDLNKPLEETNIKVTMADFNHALDEVKPAFGADVATLDRCRLEDQESDLQAVNERVNGILECGLRHSHMQKQAMSLAEQVKTSERTPLLSCLLEGPSGSGKTALAATVALDSDFPFIKIVSAESMVGLAESTKCGIINKVFEDAYKSPLSIIILDDIERLLEYVNMGPRFSNVILQTLLVLIKRIPPKGRKLLVLGTTSMKEFMEPMDVVSAFNISIHVPGLESEEIRKVLEGLDVFAPDDVDKALEVIDEKMPIKKLLMLVEMSKQSGNAEDVGAVNAGEKKIDINRFADCYFDLAQR